MKNIKLKYVPETFKALAETNFGQNLWNFLNNKENIIRMETATELGHTAVVGIEKQLLEKFKDEVLEDRVKQMLGHMVRQVMEDKGYSIEKQNVTVNSPVFTKATRYAMPGWKRMFVFRNKEKLHFCFLRKKADNLPRLPNGETWKYVASFTNPLHGNIIYDINPNLVFKEIDKKGYFLLKRKRMLRPA